MGKVREGGLQIVFLQYDKELMMHFNYDKPLTGEEIFSLIYTDEGPYGKWTPGLTNTMQKCLLTGLYPIITNSNRIELFLKQVSLPTAQECTLQDKLGIKRCYVLQVSDEVFWKDIAPNKDKETKKAIIELFTNALATSDIDLK